MNKIDTIFNMMDDWRHLPAYQLERRSDLFFALYIPQALEDKLGFAICPKLIPEFPARIGTIDDKSNSNTSKKIDYLALSKDKQKAVFVELKTDDSSRDPVQDDNYKTSMKVGLRRLLFGLLDIFRVTDFRRKYFCLIEQLAALKQYQIPDGFSEETLQFSETDFVEATRSIEVISEVSECFIIYIQPQGSDSDVISFKELRGTVLKDGDEISMRFARSLAEWARVEAGKCDERGE